VLPAVLALVVVVIVVGSVAQIGRASGPDRRTVDRSFAALAAPIVMESNASGATLNRLLARGPSLDRATFFSDLASVDSGAREEDSAVRALTPPSPAGSVADQCTSTMDDRAHAAARLAAALGRLLGGPRGVGGGDEASTARALEGAGTELRAADASWAACRRALRRGPGSARLPASVWVTRAGLWQAAAVGPFVASLLGSGSLAPLHHLTLLTITTRPGAVPGGAGVRVVPATTKLRLQIVVADSGNVDERKVTVVVTAVPVGNAPQPPPVRLTTRIRAGTSVAVTTAPLRVRPGTSYGLDVNATPGTTGAAVTATVSLRVSLVPPTTTTTTTPSSTTTVPSTTTVAPPGKAPPSTTTTVRSK
jgi:hypothetical protein